MHELDFHDAADVIYRLISSGTSTPVALRRFFDFCARDLPFPLWGKLGRLDLSDDLEGLRAWLTDVLTQEPPRRITAFWFGTCTFYVEEEPTSCLYVAGSTKYRPDVETPDTFVRPAYFPERRYAGWPALAEISRLAKRGKLADELHVDYYAVLGVMALVVAHLMRTVDRKLLLGRSSERAVAVGFDSGDMLLLGVVRPAGFEPYQTRRPSIPKIVSTPSPSEFYLVRDDHRGRWSLDHPTLANGEELPFGFATTGKPLDFARPLRSEVMKTPKGNPVDFTLSLLGPPIVTDQVGRILEAVAPGVIQRLPVRIPRTKGRYEALNLLDVVDCLDRRKSKITSFPSSGDDGEEGEEPSVGTIHRLVIDNPRAKGHDIFLLAGARDHIVVSRRVKRRLEAERVTGITFEPV